MSYKFDSMMLILNKLDRGQPITRSDLARMLGVTVRSADRYIATLRTAQFPVRFDEERGSYVFETGFSLSKMSLSAEEVLALGLAKSMVSKFGPKTAKVLDAVEHKMATCSFSLPPHVKFSGPDMPPQVEDNFKKLNFAITNLSLCEMDYITAFRGGELTHRVAEPYYLFFQEGVWYLRAYCRLKKAPRVFALDRIHNLVVLDRNFLPKPEMEASVLDDAFVDGEPVETVLRFDKECKPYLERFRGRRQKELPDGRIEVRVRTNGTKGLKLWLYRFLPCVEVVSPKELKEEIREELTKAAGKI